MTEGSEQESKSPAEQMRNLHQQSQQFASLLTLLGAQPLNNLERKTFSAVPTRKSDGQHS